MVTLSALLRCFLGSPSQQLTHHWPELGNMAICPVRKSKKCSYLDRHSVTSKNKPIDV